MQRSMWAYIFRRVLYNIPVYLGIVLLVMALLRVNDPVYAYLGKNPTEEQIAQLRTDMGLDAPFLVQYVDFLGDIVTLSFDDRSWDQKRPVQDMIFDAIPPTMAITIPQLVITALLSIAAGLISAFYRGRWLDRGLVFAMVLGMSVSYLVYIILGQFFGAFWLSEKLGFELFAIEGYQAGVTNWFHYCALPVAIGVIVAMGYDTRFYRAVMVEESGKDYITTAVSKGVGKRRIMFVHMLKNAMIPIITRIMITLPFIITGSILLEMYFGIPGMGRTLINAVNSNDFPVIQAFAALFAAFFIVSLILTDVCYALVDPRVRLS
ncbi:MAG: ABC transporter permease [Planctomycetota bacterium]